MAEWCGVQSARRTTAATGLAVNVELAGRPKRALNGVVPACLLACSRFVLASVLHDASIGFAAQPGAGPIGAKRS